MSKWIVEMAYGTNISTEVEADDRNEAIAKAKLAVAHHVEITDDGEPGIDAGWLEFESVTFIEEQTD